MFKNLTVGKRISFGFAAILAIAITLGAIAIVQLSAINEKSEHLAKEYAPEVEVVNSLERNSRRVMYEMRGYGFTEEEEFYKEALPWRETLEKRMKSAEELAARSQELVKLGPAMKLFKEEVAAYDKLMAQTKEHIDTLQHLRREMDVAAASYMESTGQYLSNQNDQMKREFGDKNLSENKRLERLEKISLINEVTNIGNNIRVKNFKSQALRDPKIYEDGIHDFTKIAPLEERLLKITHEKKDIKELKDVSEAKDAYKKAMVTFLEEWKDLQEVGHERTKVGNEVVRKAEEVSRAGVTETIEIATDAMAISNASNQILLWGLIFAALIGVILSYVLVKTITAPIIRISDGLRDASGQVASASEQLSTSSQQLSSASSEQASSIEETSSSLEEITGMVNNNVDNAKNCLTLAEEVSKTSETGNASMEQLIESMKEILASNEKIQDLVKVIGEIGEKTAIIDEIVFQTKLLSFNASVEAERAGEHGRGFAVVAQEVGNLAQMSGKAATEISAIVKESIKNAEAITAENKSKVESGNTVVVQTAKVLKEIAEKSDTVSQSLNHILSASQDQASGIGQINNAISQLDKATQENAATAEESASASEELNAQAETLNSMVSDLTRLVGGTSGEGASTRITARVQAPHHKEAKRKMPSHSQVYTNPSELSSNNKTKVVKEESETWESL